MGLSMTAKNLLAYSSWSREKYLSELTVKELDKLFKQTARLAIKYGDSVEWFAITQLRSQIVFWIQHRTNNTQPMPWFMNKMNELA